MANWNYKFPQDIMEVVAELKWYGLDKQAQEKLNLIAQHIENPDKLAELEEEWLYAPKKYNNYNYSSWGGFDFE